MIVTKMALPRRTFLRGVGAALALPLLDAMVPALSALAQAAASPVRRLGFVYIPMGMNAAAWTPALEGHITELSPSLGPLFVGAVGSLARRMSLNCAGPARES